MQRLRLKTPGVVVVCVGFLGSLVYVAHTHEVKQRKETQAIVTKREASVDRCFKEKGVPILSFGAVVCLDPCNVRWVH